MSKLDVQHHAKREFEAQLGVAMEMVGIGELHIKVPDWLQDAAFSGVKR
jgi:hypothetical protein